MIEQLIRKLDPAFHLEAHTQWRTTLFNILSKNNQMEATGWIREIFGFQRCGQLYFKKLFINKGSARNPRPIWNSRTLDLSALNVRWRAVDITSSLPALMDLFEALDRRMLSKDTEDQADVIPTASGFLKITDEPIDRLIDYKRCLLEAKRDIFISGTSMISLSEDAIDVLQEKIETGSSLRLLVLDPDWIREHYDLLTFLPSARRRHFHLEIRNSIAKLRQLHLDLTAAARLRMQLKGYRTIFPYIVTGFRNELHGRCVVEINDYMRERHRPRFTLDASGAFYQMVVRKFGRLWSSDLAGDLLK